MELRLTALGILVMASLGLYLAAGVVLLWPRLRVAGHALFAAGFAVAVAAFTLRWNQVGHIPMRNLFEVFLTMGMMMYPITLFCGRFLKVGGEAADALIGAVVLFMPAFLRKFSPEAEPLMPALQSPLFGPHVAAYLLGYVIMAKAAVQALCVVTVRARLAMLILAVPRLALPLYFNEPAKLASLPLGSQYWLYPGWILMPATTLLECLNLQLLDGAWPLLMMPGVFLDLFMYVVAIQLVLKAPARAPETQLLHEQSAYRSVALGFPALTLGLVLGAWWGKLAWSDYWNWDPKELWSLVSWLTFLLYLHVRSQKGFRYPRLNASLVIAGMVAILITLLWGSLSAFFEGMHSYGA